MLTVDEASVAYGSVLAVDAASLQVEHDEMVVVTGSNGSGKSSLLRAVLGLVPLLGGSIVVDGTAALSSADWRRRRRDIAYVPQRTAPGSFPLLARELLESSGNLEAAVHAAAELGLGDLLDRPVTTLSGGQLQRTYLARAIGALAADARLLLADEPTSALDFEGQEQVADTLARLGVGRLVVSHDAAVVERADRVLEMAGGRIRDRGAR